jgi:hypothetical protein
MAVLVRLVVSGGGGSSRSSVRAPTWSSVLETPRPVPQKLGYTQGLNPFPPFLGPKPPDSRDDEVEFYDEQFVDAQFERWMGDPRGGGCPVSMKRENDRTSIWALLFENHSLRRPNKQAMRLGAYFDDLRGRNENPASEVGCWPTRCQRVKSLVPPPTF